MEFAEDWFDDEEEVANGWFDDDDEVDVDGDVLVSVWCLSVDCLICMELSSLTSDVASLPISIKVDADGLYRRKLLKINHGAGWWCDEEA